eukprot:TRINITY_DN6168_c0_g4_i2.p1 TRINITY_DN6168_c0_g4~~TRINITY_DN6168_c0_g4_i2.p1  ORF type:complete len:542 (-),score=92.69 TRINITY_DN6168_c0_g4_i2:680-2305(-)
MITKRFQNLKFCLQRISSVGVGGDCYNQNQASHQPVHTWSCLKTGEGGAASRHQKNPFFGNYFQTEKFWQSTIVYEIDQDEEFEDQKKLQRSIKKNEDQMSFQAGNLVKQIQYCRSSQELSEILEEYDERIDQFLLTQIATQFNEIKVKNYSLQAEIIKKFVEIQDQFSDLNCLVDFLNAAKYFEIRFDKTFFNTVKKLVDSNAENFSAHQSAEIISFFQQKKINSRSLILLVQNVTSNIDKIDAQELALLIRNCGDLKLRFSPQEYSIFENAILDNLDYFYQLDLIRIFYGMGELKWKKSWKFFEPLSQKIRQYLQDENNFNPRFAVILLVAYGELLLIQQMDVIQKLSDEVLADFVNTSTHQKINIFGALNTIKNYQENFMNENFDSKIQVLREKIADSLILEMPKIQPKYVTFLLQKFTDKKFLQYYKINNDEINSKVLQNAFEAAQKNVQDFQGGVTMCYLQILSTLKKAKLINDEYDDFVEQLVQNIDRNTFSLTTGGVKILRSLDVTEKVISSLATEKVLQQSGSNDSNYDNYEV